MCEQVQCDASIDIKKTNRLGIVSSFSESFQGRGPIRAGPISSVMNRNSATVWAVWATHGGRIGDFGVENWPGILRRLAPIIWYHFQPSKPKSYHVRQ